MPRILLPLITGYIEAVWALSMKMATQAILTVFEENNFKDPLTWVIVIFAIFLGFLKVICMNFAFNYFSQLEVVPSYLSFAMILNILFGGVCLGEMWEYTEK